MVRHHSDIKQNNQESGVVLLLSVLIATAIGVAIGVGVILGGLILTQASQAHRESKQALSLANSCAELALQQIRISPVYTGTGSATINGNTCSYTVTVGVGDARTITSSSVVGASTRQITVQVSAINPKILISSWLEQ